jgi:hypothetical protein
MKTVTQLYNDTVEALKAVETYASLEAILTKHMSVIQPRFSEGQILVTADDDCRKIIVIGKGQFETFAPVKNGNGFGAGVTRDATELAKELGKLAAKRKI